LPNPLTYKQYGESAILIEWPEVIDDTILNEIIVFNNKIKQALETKIQDTIIGYNSLTILYSNEIKDLRKECEYLKSLAAINASEIKTNSKTWSIPVCYDEMFGIDLGELSAHLKLSKKEIIERHSAPLYKVFFIGFLPGFIYLGGLDNTLFVPRKENPRLHIQKGSVGIGGSQTGIYPSNSAGGWNIIGRTPIQLFDVEQSEPCFVRSGDSIQFEPISLEKFRAFESDNTLTSQFFPHD